VKQEIRIYVSGRYQFSLRLTDVQPIEETAARAKQAMNLSENFQPQFAAGLINFVAR
jgi:hypothetical protein